MHIQVIVIIISNVMMPSGGSLGGFGKIRSIAERNVDTKFMVIAMACAKLSLDYLSSADELPSILLMLAGSD